MEKVVRIFNSFKEAELADIEYWQNLSDEERIENMLALQQSMLDFFYPGVRRMEKVFTLRKKGEEE